MSKNIQFSQRRQAKKKEEKQKTKSRGQNKQKSTLDSGHLRREMKDRTSEKTEAEDMTSIRQDKQR